MAIYRADRGSRVAIVGVAALVAGLVIGALGGRITAPGLEDQLGEVRTNAAPITSALEVIRVEYPKLLAGAADPGGATSAVARIRTTFAAVRPQLATLDRRGTEALSGAIDALDAKVAARAPVAEVIAAADATERDLGAVLGTSAAAVP